MQKPPRRSLRLLHNAHQLARRLRGPGLGSSSYSGFDERGRKGTDADRPRSALQGTHRASAARGEACGEAFQAGV